MFVIDKNGVVAWFERWMPLGQDVASLSFNDAWDLVQLARLHRWSKQHALNIWLRAMKAMPDHHA